MVDELKTDSRVQTLTTEVLVQNNLASCGTLFFKPIPPTSMFLSPPTLPQLLQSQQNKWFTSPGLLNSVGITGNSINLVRNGNSVKFGKNDLFFFRKVQNMGEYLCTVERIQSLSTLCIPPKHVLYVCKNN